MFHGKSSETRSLRSENSHMRETLATKRQQTVSKPTAILSNMLYMVE